MSTRYLKKDNVVLVGIAKNGSQAIKQIGLSNNGFEIREQQGEWNQDNFIDWYDENLLILIPMRKPKERALSEMIEHAVAHDIEKIFITKLNIFQNDVMKFFVKNIMLNENWNGAQVKFFDLKLLSTHLPKYLGWDIKIPYYNTIKNNKLKEDLKEKLKNVKIETQEINELFFDSIKKSKYWIEL